MPANWNGWDGTRLAAALAAASVSVEIVQLPKQVSISRLRERCEQFLLSLADEGLITKGPDGWWHVTGAQG